MVGKKGAAAVVAELRRTAPRVAVVAEEAVADGARVVAVAVAMLAAGQRRADERVRDQREELAVTLASIGDGLIVTDRAGRVTSDRLQAGPLLRGRCHRCVQSNPCWWAQTAAFVRSATPMPA